tara:strand:+ start:270 stop:1145 length:876 start_codon:yes stop_codon:yes gene_type:complete
MKYKSYSHIGKKKVNEDYLKASENTFIVCDGVGGEVRGEIASKEIANYISAAIETLGSAISKDTILSAINQSQENLNNIIQKDESLAGMATTLAAVFVAETGFIVAHIGDSRIYVVRPSEHKFWQTWDHSLVGNLVKNGDISREAGRNHPMNNQITKAIKANFKDKITTPEINFITDIRKGDIVFICSDGVSESFSDAEIVELLANTEINLKSKIQIIEERCAEDSFDNNTAIICKVEKKDIPNATIIPLDWISIDSLKEDEDLDNVILDDTAMDEEPQPQKRKWFQFFNK